MIKKETQVVMLIRENKSIYKFNTKYFKISRLVRFYIKQAVGFPSYQYCIFIILFKLEKS